MYQHSHIWMALTQIWASSSTHFQVYKIFLKRALVQLIDVHCIITCGVDLCLMSFFSDSLTLAIVWPCAVISSHNAEYNVPFSKSTQLNMSHQLEDCEVSISEYVYCNELICL